MLEARKISVNYDDRKAVADVSLRAQAGRMIAIIGPNGAGKSTVLRALNGSVPLSGGEVLLDERRIDSCARRAVARQIAVVAQEADLRFPVTVLEFVLGGRYAWSNAWGWETEREIEIARRVLTESALAGFADRTMIEMSGGERQRVILARALATEAKIFL